MTNFSKETTLEEQRLEGLIRFHLAQEGATERGNNEEHRYEMCCVA